ncbi:MAG: hypothetical protein J6O01_05410, partial [Bacteroidales bacterium]|nr:hypothetical protein [Bacteroidales bacterium]
VPRSSGSKHIATLNLKNTEKVCFLSLFPIQNRGIKKTVILMIRFPAPQDTRDRPDKNKTPDCHSARSAIFFDFYLE